jgi:hypothetical protein
MRTNLLSDRIQVQQRTVSEGALGQTVTWKPVQWKHGRVIPLSVSAVADYQQIGSAVTHKIIFEDGVTLNLPDYRFKHNDKTYQPSQPPMTTDGNTAVVVSEI